jgi:hypothetical protein
MKCIHYLAPLALVLGGCAELSTTEQAELEATASASQAVTAGSAMYFTCNSTDWQPSAASKLTRVKGDRIDLELTFEVKQPWMVAGQGGGDDCVFVTINAEDGWGTTQTYQGVYVEGPGITDHTKYVVAPNTVARLSEPKQFKVLYPALGTYHVRVYPGRSEFKIEPVTSAPDTTPPETTIIGSSSPYPFMAVYTFESSEAGSTFECRCDVAGNAGTWRSCTSGAMSTASCGSPAGWRFLVRATDSAGNVDSTPAQSN